MEINKAKTSTKTMIDFIFKFHTINAHKQTLRKTTFWLIIQSIPSKI